MSTTQDMRELGRAYDIYDPWILNYRDIADVGFEDGWNAAMGEVNKVIHELFAANQPDQADSIHRLVWRRLLERQDAAMAERKAKRAARDEYAAEIAARKQS